MNSMLQRRGREIEVGADGHVARPYLSAPLTKGSHNTRTNGAAPMRLRNTLGRRWMLRAQPTKRRARAAAVGPGGLVGS